ncbi:hypothetical protein EIP86_007497 [Pleurotus ostreatoroseus]|nr:hypothetical protein EIP86_007497 [Pleurotus ostreatoroseus]
MPIDSDSPPSSKHSAYADEAAARKRRNAKSQAAFRARRSNYITTLEEAVTSLEGVVHSLQAACKENEEDVRLARAEIAKLRNEASDREKFWSTLWSVGQLELPPGTARTPPFSSDTQLHSSPLTENVSDDLVDSMSSVMAASQDSYQRLHMNNPAATLPQSLDHPLPTDSSLGQSTAYHPESTYIPSSCAYMNPVPFIYLEPHGSRYDPSTLPSPSSMENHHSDITLQVEDSISTSSNFIASSTRASQDQQFSWLVSEAPSNSSTARSPSPTQELTETLSVIKREFYTVVQGVRNKRKVSSAVGLGKAAVQALVSGSGLDSILKDHSVKRRRLNGDVDGV